MKPIHFTFLFFAGLLMSCSSVRVTTDYDSQSNFDSYKTFAFYKKGIDQAKISVLDKKRILREIENQMLLKGFTKSEDPDVLVSIFAKSTERVDVYNNFNPWSWYAGPFYGNNISKYTEGTLFVDLIDAKKKELLWQGVGVGALSNASVKRKEKRIKIFVEEILSKYPPTK